jgi:hypothetical protein
MSGVYCSPLWSGGLFSILPKMWPTKEGFIILHFVPSSLCLLLGKPILGAVSNEYSLMLATLVWWILFYSPGDVAYQGRILAVSL